MDSKMWITFFSQTGKEIADIAESIGRWPDRIYTNDRPEDLRTVDPRIVEKGFYTLPNKPTLEDYEEFLVYFPEATITLHGWLRIMPPEICDKFNIYNGHPGLITKYPELKGKDPQLKAYLAKHEVMGAVIHKVTAGVDEGRVLKEIFFNSWGITETEMWETMRDRSLYLWLEFLKELLGNTK
jgi:methionyl-tRNA formyltransferase